MSNFNDRLTVTLTPIEMEIIQKALRYTASQVHNSDIPAFKDYESMDMNTGEVTFDEDAHYINLVMADTAREMADTMDLIKADSTYWKVLNSMPDEPVEDNISVFCLHHKTDDFGTPLVREFIWHYTPKQSGIPTTVCTSVLEDCVMPINTQIAVHYVPYAKLDDKNVVHYYDLDDLKNKTPIITGDEDIDNVILEALRNFIIYRK